MTNSQIISKAILTERSDKYRTKIVGEGDRARGRGGRAWGTDAPYCL